jgi:hypothetical protein
MTILLTHMSQWLETGTTRRQQDPTADWLTDPQRTSHLSRTSRNRADLCREVKETTKQVTQEWVDEKKKTRYREFQQKLLRTGRSHGTVAYTDRAYEISFIATFKTSRSFKVTPYAIFAMLVQ